MKHIRRRLRLLACVAAVVTCAMVLGNAVFLDPDHVAIRDGDLPAIETRAIVPSGATHNFTVVNIRGMDLSLAERYLLASIDGLVNKNGTNLYLDAGDIDTFWFDYINKSGEYRGQLGAFASVYALVDHFKTYFDGIVVFDKDDPDQANMATPLCGLTRSLLVDHDIMPAVKAVFDAPVNYNLTRIVEDNALSNRTMKYEYAYEHFYPLANQSALAYYDEAAPHHARSFYIANNIFTLWRVNYVQSAPETGNKIPDAPDELALVARILDETPINIPIYGYFFPDGGNEGVATAELSRRGKYIIANDWAYNLPFLDAMHLPANYTLAQERCNCLPLLENKIYVAGLWSDGDNIQYVYNFMKYALWDRRQAGTVPTGWTISASCYDLMPWIMKWYYENATSQDSFVAALSGKGYMYPGEMTDAMLEAYYADVGPLLEMTDLQELHTMNIRDQASKVTSLIGSKVSIIFDGYGGSSYEWPEEHHGTPVLHSLYLTLQPNNTEQQFQELLDLKPAALDRPVFVFFNIHCWSGAIDPLFWNKFAIRLQAAGIEVVRPDVLAQLVNLVELAVPFNLIPANIMFVLSMGLAIAGIAISFRRQRA